MTINAILIERGVIQTMVLTTADNSDSKFHCCCYTAKRATEMFTREQGAISIRHRFFVSNDPFSRHLSSQVILSDCGASRYFRSNGVFVGVEMSTVCRTILLAVIDPLMIIATGAQLLCKGIDRAHVTDPICCSERRI